jgi:hypothetical protein
VQKLIILLIIFIIINNSNIYHHMSVCINEDIHKKWQINVSIKFWNQWFWSMLGHDFSCIMDGVWERGQIVHASINQILCVIHNLVECVQILL